MPYGPMISGCRPSPTKPCPCSGCSYKNVNASLQGPCDNLRRVNRALHDGGSRMNLPLKDSEVTAVGHAEELMLVHGALLSLRRGDATAKLAYQGSASFSKVAEVFNDLVEQNVTMAEELARLSQMVGKEGKLKKRASLPTARGFWAQTVEHVNGLIDDLVYPTTEAARVIGAVAQGDLSKTMALEVDGRPLEGEFLRTAKTINKMVDQLGDFSAEGTRVARGVGTEGKRGGHVEGPERVRGLDGRQPQFAGAERRRCHEGGRGGRPLEEDRGRRQGRDPRAQEHGQHHGGPAALLRRGGDAGGARGRHR